MELQRQEDTGMVVQDLLPGSLLARSQFHQLLLGLPPPPHSHSQGKPKLGPFCPGKAIIK